MSDQRTARPDLNDQDVQLVVNHVTEQLGEPTTWPTPDGYPNSLALCIIDSIQSIGVRYGAVIQVVDRYTQSRGDDRHTNTDGVPELLATFDQFGGPEGWAGEIGNQQRTSSRGSLTLKAEAIYRAAQALKQQDVETAEDLRRIATDESRLAACKSAWAKIPGQRSGISWRYLLILAGVDEVKPDRMLQRFVATSLDRPQVPNDQVAALVTAAARQLGTTPRTLDHTIWQHESAQARRRKS